MLSKKDLEFNKVLISAKKALDEISIPFHLHSGTSLGAHREKKFIPHDYDIDLAVFYDDVKTLKDVENIKTSMMNHGFLLKTSLGKLERGFQLKFVKDEVPLDIFWIYKGKYKGKLYYIFSTYYGDCNKLPYKMCVWAAKPYKVNRIKFLGNMYNIFPGERLEDIYGTDWNIVKKYGYFESLNTKSIKGPIEDFYGYSNPVKIAFCFLLYDYVKHKKIWEDFFSQDERNSHTIYSHIKEETNRTPKWISENKIKTIPTGWCEESLVYAWINLLKKALKDHTNNYFILLSGECIPLFTYNYIYKKITSSKKSRINIDYNVQSYHQSGLYYADQWMLLNREDAELLTQLTSSTKGKKWLKELEKKLNVDIDEEGEPIQFHCPDEMYIVNWFIYKYGKPSTKNYKKHIEKKPTTYTYWENNIPHPVKFNLKRTLEMKENICKSGALFARKFDTKAVNAIAMKCNDK
jgi:hypothetical protein